MLTPNSLILQHHEKIH